MFLVVLAVLMPRVLSAAETTPPNIVLVFIDDMGWSDLSCFGGEGPTTENIDQLAAEGIRFNHFYVNSPICSPSRVAITTGQYPQRWQITSYLDNRQSNDNRKVAQWLDPKAPILARELHQAGYATGHFGKWHMGGQRDVDDAPPITDYGFDQSLTNFEGMGPKLLPLAMTPEWPEPRKIWEGAVRLGGPPVWKLRSQITGGFVQTAISFIDESQRRGVPFYVNVWPDDVHSPFFPPVEDWADTKPGLYQAVLDNMDRQLGPLFERIRSDEQLRNNTLIVFCSDNGPEFGAGTCKPLRGAKTWLYEGGVRSPLIVWGPGLINTDRVGQINKQSMFSAIDLNRSLYQIAGINPPADTQLDGEPLADTLLGKSNQSRQAPIFWRRPPDRPGFSQGFQEDNPDLSVRSGKWKFYVNYDGSLPQLYNMDNDESETTDLASGYPDVAQSLQKAAMDWNATLPQDAGADQPTRTE
ncbi:sulfatase-like hydrolase/transferase [Aeoliella mucimassa]|nr:sulfatase-like hydrolase/transferase [Aeoliella mucimassa]